jgi:hypothetical protein
VRRCAGKRDLNAGLFLFFGGEGEIAAAHPGRSPSGRRCASSKIAPGDFVELGKFVHEPCPARKITAPKKGPNFSSGGEGEIRTHEPRKGPPVFKTGAFNRSATSPVGCGAILPDKICLCAAAKPLNRGHLALYSLKPAKSAP